MPRPVFPEFFAMSSMRPAEETMPIFTASDRISVNTASSCSARNSGVASMMSVTPVVFWAVRAVMALMANTPFNVMVLMSAWIPAPPLESLPAIVNAVLIIISPFSALRFILRRKVVPPMRRTGTVPVLPMSRTDAGAY